MWIGWVVVILAGLFGLCALFSAVTGWNALDEIGGYLRVLFLLACIVALIVALILKLFG